MKEDYKQYEPKKKYIPNLVQKQFGNKKKYQYEQKYPNRKEKKGWL